MATPAEMETPAAFMYTTWWEPVGRLLTAAFRFRERLAAAFRLFLVVRPDESLRLPLRRPAGLRCDVRLFFLAAFEDTRFFEVFFDAGVRFVALRRPLAGCLAGFFFALVLTLFLGVVVM